MKQLFPVVMFLAVIAYGKVNAQNANHPLFSDFPVSTTYTGQSHNPNLATPQAQKFRSRLIEGASEKANFAGHYIVIQWGCGTGCVSGAVLDALSGHVTFFPFVYVCCWGNVNADFKPISFRLNSHLIVFSGQLNEKGKVGVHYFNFDADRFEFIESIELGPSGFVVPQ
jgi:hypothetical protein